MKDIIKRSVFFATGFAITLSPLSTGVAQAAEKHTYAVTLEVKSQYGKEHVGSFHGILKVSPKGNARAESSTVGVPGGGEVKTVKFSTKKIEPLPDTLVAGFTYIGGGWDLDYAKATIKEDDKVIRECYQGSGPAVEGQNILQDCKRSF